MNKFLYGIVFFALIMLAGCYPSNELQKEQIHLQGITMGTVSYNIKYIVQPAEQGQSIPDESVIHENVEQILKQLNQDMSNWISDSELSKFNTHHSMEPVEISEGLRRVLAESIRLGHLSDGKLDVTIGPLINLWGFGPEGRPEKAPTQDEIAQAKARIGIDKLTLEGNMLAKGIPDLYVDLSTIAKGYAVDLVAEYLDEVGAHNYLVEIGGELRAKGFKHTGELWSVAIEKPVTTERAVHQIIIPKDNAIATSGDYRKYFEENGQRFSHIIDPETGKPINHTLVSVTVIHPSSMTADGLSTAMMLMGPEKAFAFAEEHQLAAYLISKSDNGFIEQITVEFMPYLK
ncbi:FAD:protein FMN transferase [Thalassotalea sp. 1_MG-2023]|uniref:FAD:protein FMN transferase n=1 Tax=Thalassotalea sp. 1_MG-2023 TaxID=3062680 RepID=UPI0026E2E8EA|nr:FAD:protein FMN transferase [Thalassotalea sp. 1_MG-2023]MDO6428651.1 FAD:protein FMN transferase [Thalassotalea sp. 1_MG-2023]